MSSTPVPTLDLGLHAAVKIAGVLSHHALVDLSRTFTRESLVTAVAATMADIPILGCRYQKGLWRDRWVSAGAPAESVVHLERVDDLEAATRRWVAVALHPERDLPLRVVVLETSWGCRILLTMLHAIVDGGGTLAVAVTLGGHLTGAAPQEIEPRRDMGLALEGLGPLPKLMLPFSAVRQAVRPTSLLRAAPRRPFVGDGAPTFADLALSLADTAALKGRVKAKGGTINDALVAVMCQALAARSERGPVTVAYTIDLRRYLARPRLVIANLSSVVMVTLTRGELRSDPLAAVIAQTRAHRRQMAGLAYLLAVQASARFAPLALARRVFPLVARWFIQPGLDRGMIMTNVGPMDRGIGFFGDDVRDLRIIGPTLKGVPVPVVAAYGLRGQLRVHIYAPMGGAVADDLRGELAGYLAALS